MAALDQRLVPGSIRVRGLFASAEVLLGNDPDGNFALIMHAWHDGRTSFAMISGFVMENVIDQFEVAPC